LLCSRGGRPRCPLTGACSVRRRQPPAGKAVFLTSKCGSCHTLKAAHATGAVSSNLDKKKTPSTPIITDAVDKNGLAMPSYKGTLTVKQIQNLAALVYTSTHG
jgi:mono/diheme cytochrome c family protein